MILILNTLIEGKAIRKETMPRYWHEPFATIDVPDTQEDVDTDLDSLTDEALEPMYRVLIHNDEVTPMEFVVMILQRIFGLTSLEAEHVMFTAHYIGLAYVTSLPLKEANERVAKAHFAAQLEGYPLTFTIEPE